MPVPGIIIIAGAAARAVATKAAGRAAGGIVGKGGKNVNPLYKNMTDKIQSNSVKVKPAGYKGVSQTQEALSKVKPLTPTPKGPNVKIVKTQAQINAEGNAKARAALGLPPRATTQELASRASKEKFYMMKSRIKRGK